jgi:hypothetical protein
MPEFPCAIAVSGRFTEPSCQTGAFSFTRSDFENVFASICADGGTFFCADAADHNSVTDFVIARRVS